MAEECKEMKIRTHKERKCRLHRFKVCVESLSGKAEFVTYGTRLFEIENEKGTVVVEKGEEKVELDFGACSKVKISSADIE